MITNTVFGCANSEHAIAGRKQHDSHNLLAEPLVKVTRYKLIVREDVGFQAHTPVRRRAGIVYAGRFLWRYVPVSKP